MSATVTPPPRPPRVTHYPDDDGLPMSDNCWQFSWILLLQSNLDVQYRNDPNVFVAGNHLIYAVENSVTVRQAPDVYVAFGRPKDFRGSYKVWQEGFVFPQVVFEVWSPNNRLGPMEEKRAFYEKYGAEEYYIVYPETPAFAEGYVRKDGKFVPVSDMNGHVSPRLGIRFVLDSGELTVYGADGKPFRSAAELVYEREVAERAAAEAERATAEAERAAAEAERAAAEASSRAETADQRAARLAAKLRELGVDPDAV